MTHLKVKNKVLQDKIGLLKKNLSFLKNLFITQAASKQDKLSQEEINDILKEVGDTDDEELNEKPGASSPTYSDDSD